MIQHRQDIIIQSVADIVASYVANHNVKMDDLPYLIRQVQASLHVFCCDVSGVVKDLEPAVSVDESITDEYLICLEDGKRLKLLKRYLKAAYGMTPEQYREKWGLPKDYPMVAPNYAKQRSVLAKNIGLGRMTNK